MESKEIDLVLKVKENHFNESDFKSLIKYRKQNYGFNFIEMHE